MIKSECEWMGGWMEEFVYCSPRVTASGEVPTGTLTGPSRGPEKWRSERGSEPLLAWQTKSHDCDERGTSASRKQVSNTKT
eukprot:1194301-Prorocentrum_minimum.AAC.8